ncbi:hypothetical protein MHYP_G00168910 [Metynnis hypsauchen]
MSSSSLSSSFSSTPKKRKHKSKKKHSKGDKQEQKMFRQRAIGELAIAAAEVYEEVLAKKPCGETVLAFANRCEAAIQGDDVKEKRESMKAGDTLLPIGRSKPV